MPRLCRHNWRFDGVSKEGDSIFVCTECGIGDWEVPSNPMPYSLAEFLTSLDSNEKDKIRWWLDDEPNALEEIEKYLG